MRRTLSILTVTTVLVTITAVTALAGAIPVITFDEVPTEFQAGTAQPVSFSILSHGKQPIDAGPASLRFQGPDGEILTFESRYDGAGRYTAEVTLPGSGQWQWAVVTGGFARQDLGTISVTPADGMAGLLTSLRVGLPIATLLAVFLLVVQLIPVTRLQRRPLPGPDGV